MSSGNASVIRAVLGEITDKTNEGRGQSTECSIFRLPELLAHQPFPSVSLYSLPFMVDLLGSVPHGQSDHCLPCLSTSSRSSLDASLFVSLRRQLSALFFSDRTHHGRNARFSCYAVPSLHLRSDPLPQILPLLPPLPRRFVPQLHFVPARLVLPRRGECQSLLISSSLESLVTEATQKLTKSYFPLSSNRRVARLQTLESKRTVALDSTPTTGGTATPAESAISTETYPLLANSLGLLMEPQEDAVVVVQEGPISAMQLFSIPKVQKVLVSYFCEIISTSLPFFASPHLTPPRFNSDRSDFVKLRRGFHPLVRVFSLLLLLSRLKLTQLLLLFPSGVTPLSSSEDWL